MLCYVTMKYSVQGNALQVSDTRETSCLTMYYVLVPRTQSRKRRITKGEIKNGKFKKKTAKQET
jgi:hypothetical protein